MNDLYQIAAGIIIAAILIWFMERWKKHRQIQRWHDHMINRPIDEQFEDTMYDQDMRKAQDRYNQEMAAALNAYNEYLIREESKRND